MTFAAKASALLIGLSLSLTAFAAASSFEKFARKDQVAASDLILTGKVVSVSAAWAPDHSGIQTESEIAIDDAWKGAPDSDRVTVRTPGGTVGTIALKVDGAAEFKVGERVVVFLKRNGTVFESVAMRFGKYEIVGDGDAAAVVGNLPTDITAAQRYEQVSLPLDDLRNEVKKLVGEERR